MSSYMREANLDRAFAIAEARASARRAKDLAEELALDRAFEVAQARMEARIARESLSRRPGGSLARSVARKRPFFEVERARRVSQNKRAKKNNRVRALRENDSDEMIAKFSRTGI